MENKKDPKQTRNAWKNGLGLAVLGIGIAIACVACLPAAGFVVAGVMVSSTAIATTTAALSVAGIAAATAKAGLHAYDAEYADAAMSLACAVPLVGALQASTGQLRLSAAGQGKGQTSATGVNSAANRNTSPNVAAGKTADGTGNDPGLSNRGYKPNPGERTLDGYVKNNVPSNAETGLKTNSPGFNNNNGQVGGQFKRFGSESHGGLSPHVHQPTRNVAPNGNTYGGTGSKTSNGGVTSPTQKDVKQLYDYLNNGKYR